MKLSKHDAALEQLDCAIKLHFENSSASSVCTLVGAASRILTDIIEHKHPGASWDAKAQAVCGLSEKEYFRIARELPNSLKHAERDPESEIEISFTEVDSQIIQATLNASILGNLSIHQKSFQVWYFAIYGLCFNTDLYPVVRKSISLIGNMHELHREQQLQRGLEFIRAQGS